MNKSAIATILGTATLSLLSLKGSKSGTLRSDNELSAFSKNRIIEYASNPEKAPLVSSVDLTSQGLYSIPVEIGKFINLKRLMLANNNLNSLPSEIKNLKNLEVLDLGHNQFTDMPKEITSLTNLKKLYLNKNPFSSLPKEIENLKNLEELELKAVRNVFESNSMLPEIFKLKNLKKLDLSYCNISSYRPKLAIWST